MSDEPADDEEREPLADLAAEVEAAREHEDDDEFEELFTDVDVGAVDQEAVWEELSASADEPAADVAGVGTAAAPGEPVETGDSGGTAERAASTSGDVRVVEKRLCQGCPHFADPPATACTHEGTTIEAEVDTDHFRVVDCPVVAEREDAEASDFSAEEE